MGRRGRQPPLSCYDSWHPRFNRASFQTMERNEFSHRPTTKVHGCQLREESRILQYWLALAGRRDFTGCRSFRRQSLTGGIWGGQPGGTCFLPCLALAYERGPQRGTSCAQGETRPPTGGLVIYSPVAVPDPGIHCKFCREEGSGAQRRGYRHRRALVGGNAAVVTGQTEDRAKTR